MLTIVHDCPKPLPLSSRTHFLRQPVAKRMLKSLHYLLRPPPLPIPQPIEPLPACSDRWREVRRNYSPTHNLHCHKQSADDDDDPLVGRPCPRRKSMVRLRHRRRRRPPNGRFRIRRRVRLPMKTSSTHMRDRCEIALN